MEVSDTTLIFRNLEEVISRDVIEEKLAAGRRLSCYIGFAPTGQIHLGYLVPCMKIRDLTLAGCNVAIMLADLHALLDERKTPSHLVQLRSEYYQRILTKILEILGADLERVKFVRGSEFQLTEGYIMDMLDLSSRVTTNAAKKAGTEVVKQNKDSKLGSAIYPVMQAIDENYVGQATFGVQVDMELGGIDQRKIFCFSRDWDKVHTSADESKDKGKISYLMTPIISLSKSGKMSSSDQCSKISFHDGDEVIATRIKKAFCCDGDPDCGLMKLMKCVFFPFQGEIVVTIDNGKRIRYPNYDLFEEDFRRGVFGAKLVKKVVVTQLLYSFVYPIRQYMYADDMQELIYQAYPE